MIRVKTPSDYKKLAKTAPWTRENKMEVTNFTGLKVEHMACFATVRLYVAADNYEVI